MRNSNTVSTEDVERLYTNGMLGPSGQNDLAHYENRLADGLDENTYTLAREILAEAALTGSFSHTAEKFLAQQYKVLISDVQLKINEALDVLQHDGYLEQGSGGYRFISNLLRDWWKARYENHFIPLQKR